MKRYVLLALALFALVFPVFAAGVTISYGSTKNYSLELNEGQVYMLGVTITDLNKNVSYLTAISRSGAEDRVYCAPSPNKVSGDSADFTCVIVPGDAFTGEVVFSAFDVNDHPLKDTVLDLTATYAERWYTAKTIARVGSTVSVGPYNVLIKKASFLYVLLVVDNQPVTAFVNEETRINDNLKVIYKGFDPDTHEVFLEFESTMPISLSVQEKQYYIVVPKVVYSEGNNHYEIPVQTNCSAIEYRIKGSDEWKTVEVTEDFEGLTLDTNADRVYVRCVDDPEKSTAVYLKRAKVIVKEKEVNASVFCPAHGYVEKSKCELSPERKAEVCSLWASANGYRKIPPGYICKPSEQGPSVSAIILLLVILALAAVAYYYKKRGGFGISIPSREPSREDVTRKTPFEEAGDVE